MKITTLIITLCLIQVSAATRAQITLEVKRASLQKVLETISTQSGYDFVYSTSDLKNLKVTELNLNDVSIQKALDVCFEGQPLQYEITDKTVMIRKKTDKTVIDQVKAFIQAMDITGRVTDKQGVPVPGATVKLKDGSQGTTTDENGLFTLKNVQAGVRIVISFIGYETLILDAKSEMGSISLEVATSKLDEVKVQAYGVTSQRLTTGNIASVKAADITKQPVTNPLLALSGRMPGVTITQANGLPNSGVTIRIQGQNSIGYGNDPFYVIDGVPFTSQLLPTVNSILGNSGNSYVGSIQGTGNPFSFINPNDIESIEVLKDADATAIYGSRAANGAVLITTKKGKAGQSRVNFKVQNGWGKVTRMLPMMNNEQYFAMRREALTNDGLAIPTRPAVPENNVNAANSNYDYTVYDPNKNTDWQKELIGKTAQFTDAQVDLTGGNSSTTYRINAGFNRQTTVFPKDYGDSKGSFGFNINHTSPNKRLKVQASGTYMVDQNNIAATDLTSAAIKLAPNAPNLYNSDGSLNWQRIKSGADSVSTWANPLATNDYRVKTNNLVSNLTVGYNIIKGLDLKVNTGYTNLATDEIVFGKAAIRPPESRAAFTRSATYGNGTAESWIVEPQVSYNTLFGKGRLDVLLGSTFQASHAKFLNLRATGFTSDAVEENPLAATGYTIQNSINNFYRYNAFFGRINFNWEDKYIINLTGRRDGSSRFGPENRFHNFGAIGAAWLFSNERFIAENVAFLSFGKLRGSYGTTGNDQIGDYAYINKYNPVSYGNPYQGGTSLTPASLYNPYLQWELTKKLQFGIDLGFLHDRLLINANYYRNTTDNQLLPYALPITTGFTSILQNFPATVRNYGWEFTVNTINIKSTDFNWTSSINFTLPYNKLVAFPGLATSSFANSKIVGQPINITKSYQYAQVNPQTGLYQFYDVNGILTANPSFPNDQYVVLNPNPKFFAGFQNSFSYKSLRLDVLIEGRKQKAFNAYATYTYAGLFGGTSTYGNLPTYFSDRWQKAGDVTDIQKYSTVNDRFTAGSSDLFFADASYVRLKNVALSWELPKSLQQRLRMDNCRVFVNGQNVATITSYKGLDPENTSTTSLPPLRVWTIGIQAGF